MSSYTVKEKKIKELTISEFKHLIQESIAEDIEAWKETFDILSDKAMMKQIRRAEMARAEGKKSYYIPWEKVKRDV